MDDNSNNNIDNQAQRIVVRIFGEDYPIRTMGNEEHIQQIAEYVDQKMCLIEKHTSINAPMKLAVLAALNIADELFTLRKEKDHLTNEVTQKAQSITDLLDKDLSEWEDANSR